MKDGSPTDVEKLWTREITALKGCKDSLDWERSKCGGIKVDFERGVGWGWGVGSNLCSLHHLKKFPRAVLMDPPLPNPPAIFYL